MAYLNNMAGNKILTDGTINWVGGMDTSRSPSDIAQIQYSKAVNVILRNSIGGISCRPGIHCCSLEFDSDETEEIYKNGIIQAEGHYETNNIIVILALVSGYVFRFLRKSRSSFYVENITRNSRNLDTTSPGWIIKVPNGCIVNNGFDPSIYISGFNISRRLNPSKKDIPISKMGVYIQNRLFVVSQDGKQIYASDFMQPTRFTLEDTNIFGFMCPDSEEKITAIGKQKSILGTAEGGNLIWSSTKDIYSVDVRGTRSEWAASGSRIGKTTETIPGFSAASSYSFEAFNTNIYFRSGQHGIVNLRQADYQYTNYDAVTDQSIEASYFLDNDTNEFLGSCYSRSYNRRLLTTVSPQIAPNGGVIWNGILSFHPAVTYSSIGTIPRRFESVFTGVRPWCLTVVSSEESSDELFIHSCDIDGVNRFYYMDELSDYDIDQSGRVVEIEGFIETRGYTFENPLLLKQSERRFYRLGKIERSVKIKLFSRPENNSEWVNNWDEDHLVCRVSMVDGVFNPSPSKPQTRSFVFVSSEKFSECYKYGSKFLSLQYRLEFKGPINLEAIVTTATLHDYDKTIQSKEKDCNILQYEYTPDYQYSIAKI